jgi:mannose-6-phosphate isomerase
MASQQTIFPITGRIFSNPYDWGGKILIPPTLGFEPKPGVPYAEYWLGVHKKAPSQVQLLDDTTTSLDHLIEKDPESFLGHTVAKRFGTMPFLFKLLDAKEMLSIQVHPNIQQAQEGFALEEKKGIPLDDPKRTYKDPNQKSEYAITQGEFWLLHGFRQAEDLENILDQIPEFELLKPYFKDKDYYALYKYIMIDLDDKKVNELLDALAKRIIPLYEKNELKKTNPDYWAAKAIKYMKMTEGNYDRGLISIYLLNLVHMNPGEAIFQRCGVLHAYLEGPIIEVMTNSDNVARGGITSKYIDIEALMTLVTFEGVTPNIIQGRTKGNEDFFDVPLEEFSMSKIMPTIDHSYGNKSASIELFMGMKGEAKIGSEGQVYSVEKGKSVVVKANTAYEITGNEGDEIYRISIPLE